MAKSLHYYAVYKPCDMVSQFTDPGHAHATLKSLYDFPKDVYPVGRLDKDTEGLLILSNDRKLNNLLLN
jgi:23S rRNA pseudouridine2457 synthase